MRALKEAGILLDDLDLKTLKYVISNLKSAQSGMVHRGVDLLQEITELEEEDPGFWSSWWEDYLLKHAGEKTGS
jgi:hypothetical protein